MSKYREHAEDIDHLIKTIQTDYEPWLQWGGEPPVGLKDMVGKLLHVIDVANTGFYLSAHADCPDDGHDPCGARQSEITLRRIHTFFTKEIIASKEPE